MRQKYIITEVDPDELHQANHQPSDRMEWSSSMTALKRSIQEVGLQYPPLVVRRQEGDGFTIVDGHRRISVAKSLGWPKVSVLVAEGKASELFSAVSGTTKQITATQWVEVYLKGGDVPSGATRVNIKRLDEVVGRDFLQKLSTAKLSPQVWSLANRAIRYADMTEEDRPGVLNWLVDHKIGRQVGAWITGGNSPHELRKAFHEGREPTT